MSQLSKTSFGNLYGTPSGTTFPDNTTGYISEGGMRQFGKDILDSAMFLSDNFIDEDSFASDSATKVPSQQSVKAYVDANAGSPDTDIRFFEQEDFIGEGASSGVPGFLAAQSGTSAGTRTSDTTYSNTTENVIGMATIDGGNDINSYAVLTKTSSIFFGAHAMRLRMRVAISNIGDVTDNYTVRFGFGDATASGEATDGAYFKYNYNVNGGRWQCTTSAAGVRTETDSTVAATAGEFKVFEIHVNEAGTSVTFYIDSVLVATNTTNIPTGSNFTSLNFQCVKVAGTNERDLFVDWYDLLITRTTAR